jgi:hypothetical protein
LSEALFKSLGATGSEYAKRVQRDKTVAARLYEELFKQQRQVEDDPHPYKIAICPRRAGKSKLGANKSHRKCLTKPGARVLICGLTVNSTKRAFWRALQETAKKYGIEGDKTQGTDGWNRTDLSFTLWNGSYIFLVGADTEDKIERLRGDEYDLVIIDEPGSFAPDRLAYLIYDVIMPAVGTRGGEIWMTGTPGHFFSGPFFYGTNPDKADEEGLVHGRWFEANNGVMTDVMWSAHRWTMADNIGVPCDSQGIPLQWLRALDDKRRRKWRDDHPTWRREMLGLWVPDEDGLVYALNALRYKDPERVVWRPSVDKPGSFGLPDGEWSLLLGIDLGWEDPTAFVVVAVSAERQELRELHSEKHKHLELGDVRDVYQRLLRQFGAFDAVVVDPSAKQSVKTLMTDYGVPCVEAERTSKAAYQQALNADMHSGRIKVIGDSELCKEMCELAWDLTSGSKAELSRKGSLKEDNRLHNHCCDAFLYLWRYSAHRWETDRAAPEPDRGTAAWLNAQQQLLKEQSFARRQQAIEDSGLFDGDDWGIAERREVFGGRYN